MSITKASLFLLLFVFFSCNEKKIDKNSNPAKLGLDTTAYTYSVTSEDFSMNLAINKAKKTIAEFDTALNSNNNLYTDFAIKKRYITPDGGGEHMWISGIKIVNGNYRGVINNDAEKTKEVKYGDTVIVHKDEITDWMYLYNNVLRGGYTIREVRNQLNKDERIKMEKDLGFKIED